MRNGEWNKLVSVATRILLAFVFVFAQGAWAGQDQKTKNKADATQKASAQQAQEKQTPVPPAKVQSGEAQSTAQAQSAAKESAVAEEKPSGDGSHQGIKVHGHWTIEVRNPDGTLVTHREFENSLVQGTGTGILAALLVHGIAAGAWEVQFWGSAPGLCAPSGLNPPCIIGESVFGTGVNSNNLIVTPNAGSVIPSTARQFTLSGSLSGGVPFAGTITTVGTYLSTCVPSITPVACSISAPGAGSLGILQFTQATISPISVTANQIVQVTVVISFS